jgi:hypothetical protein
MTSSSQIILMVKGCCFSDGSVKDRVNLGAFTFNSKSNPQAARPSRSGPAKLAIMGQDRIEFT